MLYCHLHTCRKNHNYTMIKDERRLLYKIYTSQFICKVRKGCMGFHCERELETKHNCNILTPLLWPSALCLPRSPGLLNRRPRGPLCWVIAFFTVSYQQLLWTPTQSGAPSPFGLPWLSLPHLVYNFVRSLTVWLLSWLSYIIVQRPLSHLLDLWNRMFDRHQA